LASILGRLPEEFAAFDDLLPFALDGDAITGAGDL
jgi:hypothetical protein